MILKVRIVVALGEVEEWLKGAHTDVGNAEMTCLLICILVTGIFSIWKFIIFILLTCTFCWIHFVLQFKISEKNFVLIRHMTKMKACITLCVCVCVLVSLCLCVRLFMPIFSELFGMRKGFLNYSLSLTLFPYYSSSMDYISPFLSLLLTNHANHKY